MCTKVPGSNWQLVSPGLRKISKRLSSVLAAVLILTSSSDCTTDVLTIFNIACGDQSRRFQNKNGVYKKLQVLTWPMLWHMMKYVKQWKLPAFLRVGSKLEVLGTFDGLHALLLPSGAAMFLKLYNQLGVTI